MSEQVRAIVAKLREQLEALYGERLERMILFGSQARGDAVPESDIDVLVVLRGQVDSFSEIERTSEIIGNLSLEHNVALSRAFISAKRYQVENSPFLLNVRREGMTV